MSLSDKVVVFITRGKRHDNTTVEFTSDTYCMSSDAALAMHAALRNVWYLEGFTEVATFSETKNETKIT